MIVKCFCGMVVRVIIMSAIEARFWVILDLWWFVLKFLLGMTFASFLIYLFIYPKDENALRR